MPNPIEYNPGYSFDGYQELNPTLPLPAQQLDEELIEIAEAINGHRLNIMDIRRADGKLQNGIVTPDSLSDSVRSFLGVDGVTYPFRANVRVVATAPVDMGGEQEIDGVELVGGDRILLTAQSSASQNGIWVVGNTWSRAADLAVAADFVGPIIVPVAEGTAGRNKVYSFSPAGAVTVGSTAIDFIEGFPGAVLAPGSVGAQELADNGVTLPKLETAVQNRLPLRAVPPTYGTAAQSTISAALAAAASRELQFPDAQISMGAGVTSSNPVDLRGFGTGSGPGPAAQANSRVTQFIANGNFWDFEITSNYPSFVDGIQFNQEPSARPQTSGGAMRFLSSGATTANTIIDRVGVTNKNIGIEFHKPSYPQIRGLYADAWTTAAVRYTTDASNEGLGGLLLHPYLFGTSGSTTQGAAILSEVAYTTALAPMLIGAAYNIDWSVKNHPAGRFGVFAGSLENAGLASIRARTQDGQAGAMLMVHGCEFLNVGFADDMEADILIEDYSGGWLDTVSLANNVHRHLPTNPDFDVYRILSGNGVRIDNPLINFLGGSNTGAAAFNIGSAATRVFINQPMILGTVTQPYGSVTAATNLFDTINNLTVSQVPSTAANGSLVYTSDGRVGGDTMSGGSTGAYMARVNGVWQPVMTGNRVTVNSATVGVARFVLDNPDNTTAAGFDLVWAQGNADVFIDRTTYSSSFWRRQIRSGGNVLFDMRSDGRLTLTQSTPTVGAARLALNNPDTGGGAGFDLAWAQGSADLFYDRVTYASGAWRRRILSNTGAVLLELALDGKMTMRPPASATPENNGDVVVQATSNTSLTFKLKGSDGTVRSGSITLS